MDNKWRIKVGDKVYSSKEIARVKIFIKKLQKEGKLDDTVKILPPGKKDWTSPQKTDELKDLFNKKTAEPTLQLNDDPKTSEVNDTSPENINCPNCGYENKKDAIYCSVCSAPFKKNKKRPPATAKANKKSSQSINSTATAGKKKSIVPLLITVILLGGLGYNLYTNFIGGHSPEKAATAADEKFLAEVKEFIASGQDINKKNSHGFTKLTMAVEFDHVNSVELLLQNGADPNEKVSSEASWTVLFETINEMSFPDDDPTRSRKIAELLLEYGADVSFYNPVGIGETPLYVAASRGRADLCRLFIEYGANVNSLDKLDETPLHQAAKNGYWEAVKVLLDNGASVNSTNKLNETPLVLAKKRSQESYYNDLRNDDPAFYPDADYDKTIELLETY